jgi:phage-related protein
LYEAAVVKALLWVGSSRKDMRAFAKDVRQRAGYELYQVQCGLEPSDSKPMRVIGPGVREIRVRTGREHRVIYIAKFEESVYVLHAFEKKTRRTARADIELARSGLRDALALRQRGLRDDRPKE